MDQLHLSCFTSLIFIIIYMVPYRAPKKMYVKRVCQYPFVVFCFVYIHYCGTSSIFQKSNARMADRCIILYYHQNQRLCLQSASYKFCNLTSFIRLRRKIKNNNNIYLKLIMLTDNNQIFRNCFVIIYCHLTKVSSQINKFIIFQPNELSITLSTL